jgi:transitional endoplasmic reticulum ATPase
LSNITHGFVGADLNALAKEAALKALGRYVEKGEVKLQDEIIAPEILEKLKITKPDFMNGLKDVQPSALREVAIEVPNIKWDQIGALESVKQELKQAVEWPIKNPAAFKEMGISPPKGVLLYGPPGTGKTLLAKAVATESEANFISIKGPELLSMWVGEGERGVRKIFKKARQVSPCVVFFDELDAMAPRRGAEVGNSATERMVNQLLTELDGVESLHDVVFIAATNRPDLIDPALLRPGRIDKLIMVPAPDERAREAILKVHTRNVKLDKDVSIKKIAEVTKGFSGADLEGLVREAALSVLSQNSMKPGLITMKHFEEVLKKMNASIDDTSEKAYSEFKEKALDFRPSYVG